MDAFGLLGRCLGAGRVAPEPTLRPTSLRAGLQTERTEHLPDRVPACWTLGRPTDWAGLRRWAHMLGFGGHFLTKSRMYSITFRYLRDQRIIWRQTQTTGPDPEDQVLDGETVLVVNFLQFVGAGWHNLGDALLANTAADMARRRREAARDNETTALAH